MDVPLAKPKTGLMINPLNLKNKGFLSTFLAWSLNLSPRGPDFGKEPARGFLVGIVFEQLQHAGLGGSRVPGLELGDRQQIERLFKGVRGTLAESALD